MRTLPNSSIPPSVLFDQVRSTVTVAQSKGSNLAPSTLIYGDERDVAIHKRFAEALAKARAGNTSGKTLSLSPQAVLGDDAPPPMSMHMQQLVLSDVFTNTVLTRNSNPEALAEVSV
jgi:hypothetical protein